MISLLKDLDGTILAKAVRDPRRALLRLVLRARLARRDVSTDLRDFVATLSSRYRLDGEALQAEYRRSSFYEWFLHRREELAHFPGPYRHGTTGRFGCEALYLLVRAARPRTIVETGVLYGASSAHILAALARNGEGTLYSVEVGRKPDEPPHEYFVPEGLRDRWRLIIGDARRELPAVLQRCAPVGMFYHDSLHTFDHMLWEFETALPYIVRSGLLASDDVLNPTSVAGIFSSGPFRSFCSARQIPFATFQNLGIGWPERGVAGRVQAA